MRDLYWDLIAVKGIAFLFELIEILNQRKNLDMSNLCNDMGHMAADLGYFEEAIQIFQKGLEFNPTTSLHSTLLNNIGTIFTQQQKGADALPFYLEALKYDDRNGRNMAQFGKNI